MLTTNRATNQVNNATWIREQMCVNGSSNSLFRGVDALQNATCSLPDSNLTTLVTFVSSQINFTQVKEMVIIISVEEVCLY